MTNMVQERYVPNFASLTAEQTLHVFGAVQERYGERFDHVDLGVPESGLELMALCDGLGLDQADVVWSMARDATVEGVVCIEALVGKPIVRRAQASPITKMGRGVARANKRRAERHVDLRIVSSVVPNPKKPGSKSWERYNCYEAGLSVADCVKKGVTLADVKWDYEHGFIEFAPLAGAQAVGGEDPVADAGAAVDAGDDEMVAEGETPPLTPEDLDREEDVAGEEDEDGLDEDQEENEELI